ncbi:MAG: HD-GYP domain-containing protein [Solirubrobacterales bacterium]
MSVHAIKEAERMRDSYAQRGRPMDPAHLRGELLIGGCYLAAALALLGLGDLDGFSAATALLYVAAVALAGHVRFDVAAGFTVPTQALFVPMLFALPVALVPLLVPLALGLGMAPRILRGEIAPSWLLTALGNSWFAIGPAVVLALAGDHNPIGGEGILLLALASQFACDFTASIARERLYGGVGVRELAAEVRPIYAIDLALSTLGLLVAFAAIGLDNQLVPILLLAPLFGVLGFLSKERHERLAQLAELNDAYQGTALLLGDVVEADDAYTGEHCKSVVRLALDVCDELDLDADHKRNVEFAALLHDVGKIAVPKEIINKTGELDEREWAIMKTHTIEGQKMLETIGGFMTEIGRIVRASHERWDGSGYPDGLSGEEIPLEARVVSTCDAFNAMTTTRSYRTAMPLREAVAELERCAGTHFDPEVVRALLRTVAAPAALEAEPSAQPAPASELLRGLIGAERGVTRPGAGAASARRR